MLYYLSGGQGTTGCGAGHDDCVKRILLVGTPAMWFLAFFVAAWALWRAIARLDWRYTAVLVAYSAGYTADHWCHKGHVVLVIAGAITIAHAT